MKKILLVLKNLAIEESGQDLIEYALIIALVGLAAVAALNTFATAIKTALGNIGSALSTAVPASGSGT